MTGCMLGCLDKIFLGHFVRPLFNGNNDAGTIRDGLTNTVVTAGVVGALVFSLTLEAAMNSTPNGNFYATTASFCWYASSGNACWSILSSTLAAVALAITPEERINIIGKKLLYCWVIPFETTMFSVAFMGLGMWMDAERGRETYLLDNYNWTGTDAFTTFKHGGIVIWSVRLFMLFTFTVGSTMAFVMFCCGERVERATGIEAQSMDEAIQNKEVDEQKSTVKVVPADE
jgi:hypothetical protein